MRVKMGSELSLRVDAEERRRPISIISLSAMDHYEATKG